MIEKQTEHQADLTLVILNYNSQFWLEKLLTSLKKFCLKITKYQIKVIVVDNDSQDRSVAMVKSKFSFVSLIKLAENLGFAAGNNQALKSIDSTFVMLLNSDTEFTAQTNLDILLDFMLANPQVAACTPKLVLPTGQIDQASHRGEPTIWAFATYYLGLEKLFPKSKLLGQYHQSYKDFSKSHLIDACSGAAMLVRTADMKKVGYLDEQFFMYAEDLDWCKRFRDAGYHIAYVPLTTITHHKYKSGLQSDSSVTTGKIKRYFYNTMLLYYDKHYKNKYPHFFRLILRLFLFVKRGGF